MFLLKNKDIQLSSQIMNGKFNQLLSMLFLLNTKVHVHIS